MRAALLTRALPKADLHSHIDGSIPAKELFAIAESHGRRMHASSGKVLGTPSELMAHIMGNGYGTMLEDIVSRFEPIVGLMQTEEVLRDVGVAYVREQKKRGVLYAEGRFAPQYHTKEGLTLGKAIGSLHLGLMEGQEKHGVRTNLIVAIGRESTPDLGLEVARAAVESRRAVALDLGGREQGNPPEKFRKAFAFARTAGLKVTVHAGEGAGSINQNLRNIRTAVRQLHANRIGHAIDLSKDESLVRLVLRSGVGVEMNPISNLTLKKIADLRDLGIGKLLDAGVMVTVNSDDPALWPGGTLDQVLGRVFLSCGLSLPQLGTLIGNSFRSAFAPEPEREWMLEEYQGAWKRSLG